MIQERLQEGRLQHGAENRNPRGAREVTGGSQEYLELDESSGKVRCRRCHYVYCNQGEDPREFALQRLQELNKAGPWLAKPWNGNSPNFVLKESICPSCGVLFDVVETPRVDVERPEKP